MTSRQGAKETRGQGEKENRGLRRKGENEESGKGEKESRTFLTSNLEFMKRYVDPIPFSPCPLVSFSPLFTLSPFHLRPLVSLKLVLYYINSC